MNRAAAILAALAFLTIAFFGVRATLIAHTFMGDFRAFYCAGELAREGTFDYSLDRIAPCESREVPGGYFAATPSLVVPAPLPGYAIAPFAASSLLDYAPATVVWWLVLLAATVLAAWVVALLGWARFDVALVAFAFPAAIVSMPLGELPPIALAGIALCALGMQRDAVWLRISGFVLAATQPQMAVALAIAMVSARPKTWREVAAVALILGVASVATIGLAQNVAYVRDFLPAHVASEILRVQQYTVSWVFAELGAPLGVAAWIGRVVYVIALACAAVVSRRVARAGEFAGAIAVAIAIALLGGPFVHLDHLLCALPAALWLASRKSVSGIVAAVLLALPVTSIFANPFLVFAVAIFTFWIASSYGISRRRSAYAALGAMAIAVALAVLSVRFGFAFRSAAHDSGNAWATYVATHNVVGGVLVWIVKAPLWIALIVLVAAAWRISSSTPAIRAS